MPHVLLLSVQRTLSQHLSGVGPGGLCIDDAYPPLYLSTSFGLATSGALGATCFVSARGE
eukprot:5243944-Pyramimonas_sp.AAC.1